MPKVSDTDSSQPTPLAERLRSESKETLAGLLEELAGTHPEVAERLARHQLAHDPAQLAKLFRKRLDNWKRPQRFLERSAAGSFGRALEAWLDEIERELLPLDAARAHALADTFVASDGHFFEQADDSDGAIGDAVRAGCRLWLRSAKAHPKHAADYWIERVYTLANADEYGAREALLEHSALLFDEAGLRALAQRYETELDKALSRRSNEKRDYGVYKISAAIDLIADALQDPDLSTQTTLRLSPEPNALQKESIAQRYLRFGRPQQALAWLDGDWAHHELAREYLLAEVYAALGESLRLRELRQRMFERSGSLSDFEAWQRTLAPEQQSGAAELARSRALQHQDPIAGARLLLALNDDAAAEALLLERRASVRGEDYIELVPLAKALEQSKRPRAAIVCYRALLLAILARAYAKAYGHGADYLHALRRLDTQMHDYGGLESHDAFEAALRRAHPRKLSFWNRL